MPLPVSGGTRVISEKANFRMRAALHAIRPGEVLLPASLAAAAEKGDSLEIPRQDELADLFAISLAYARACLRAADRPATALFAISEPYDDVIPVSSHVTLFDDAPAVTGFEDDGQPLMLLSTEKADFRYACNDEQAKVMADTTEALKRQGHSEEDAVALVNEFWAEPGRRWALLYGDWIGQQTGEHWARLLTQ
ncbi:hypothetical protein [Lentzea aerocolonigenes]|uniref:hypothetical protein n=1 Tax=Lentzea aerocolonigenes TaxID=68170 RepID=UPI0012E1230D|nr:hypothetical protein [Lentzea aerocolonigenes]